jgi:hypothetical protein
MMMRYLIAMYHLSLIARMMRGRAKRVRKRKREIKRRKNKRKERGKRTLTMRTIWNLLTRIVD